MKEIKKKKPKDLRTRTFNIGQVRAEEGEDGEKRIRIAISTEAPCLTYGIGGHQMAYEILSHERDAIDFTYLNNSAPFLFEHSPWEQVGVLENVSLDDDKVLRADVRFSNREFAQGIMDDMERSIRPNISVGYYVKKFEDTGEMIDGIPVVRATDWMVIEASSVVTPADLNAKVGRSKNIDDLLADMSDEDKARLLTKLQDDEPEAEEEVDDESTSAEDVAENDETAETEDDESETEAETEEDDEEDEKRDESVFINDDESADSRNLQVKTNMSKTENSAPSAENIRKITDLAVKYGMTDKLSTWLAENRSYEALCAEVLETRKSTDVTIGAPAVHTRDNKTVSIGRAIEAMLEGDNSLLAEMGQDTARARGIKPRKNAVVISPEMPLVKRSVRSIVTTDSNAGGYLANQYLSYEQALTEESVLGKIGCEFISPTDVVKIPRGTNAAGAWVGEGSSISATSGSVSVLTLSPKLYSVAIPFSRTMRVTANTYPLEDVLRNEIYAIFSEAQESAVFAGTGGSEPEGIYSDDDVPYYNSGSAQALSAAVVGGMWATARTNKSSANNFKWVTTPVVFTSGSQQAQVSSVSPLITPDNKLYGYPVFNSALMPTTLPGAANKHGLIGGDFTKVVVATWALELVVDELSNASTGIINLRGYLHADSGIRNVNALIKHWGITA